MAVPIFLTVCDREWVTNSYFCVSSIILVVSNRSQLSETSFDAHVNSNALGHLPELRGHRDHQ